MSFVKEKTLGLFVKTGGTLSKPLYGGKGVCLMFHRVRPTALMSDFEQNRMWEVTPEHLEDIIHFFERLRYDFIIPSQLDEYMASNSENRFVLFTFDDGYKDNIDYAYPIFRKHKLPFTVFVTTEFISGKRYPWEFLLENKLLSENGLSFIFEDTPYSFSLSNKKEKSIAYSALYPLFKANNKPEKIDQIITTILGNNIDDFKTIDIITPSDLKEYANDEYIHWGIHAHNHYVLSQLTPTLQDIEISEAQRYLNNTTGISEYAVAYPFGGLNDINKDTLIALKKSGIRHAFTTWPGNIFKNSQKNLLSRHTMFMRTDKKELNYIINGIRHFSYNGFSTHTKMENNFKM